VARPSLKKVSVQKIFSSSQLNCSRARRRYNIQEFKKARPEVRSLEKSGREGSFGLIRCLVGADGTGEGGLTGGGDVVNRGGATVGAGAGTVISWVSCCIWAVRPARVLLITCSEAF